MVTFHDEVRYSEALRIGQQQKKIMDEVMARPDIKTNWENLNFEEIINKL
jgi:kynurenine 3-monooxygenase